MVRRRRPRRARLGFQRHLALMRELERVADKVRQHLTETKRIADQAVGNRRLLHA